jgi:hypothetical protein
VYLDSGSIKVEAQVQGEWPKDEEPSEASPEES